MDRGDAGLAPPACDLGVFLAATCPRRPELRAPFCDGYRSRRPLPAWVALAEALRSAQDLAFMATEPENPIFLPRRAETARETAREIVAAISARLRDPKPT